jgi:hypothetical protein
MLFPFESIFRVTTNLAMQYSGLLILNLSVIGLLLKQGDSFIN